MKIYTAEDVLGALTYPDLLDPLARAMIGVSEATATHPPRTAMPINPAGRLGVMYGALADPPVHGAKILSLFPDAPKHGLSSHQGFVLLFESELGTPIAALNADAVTVLRTAAMSMLATQVLANPDPRTVTICGAGEQADSHARASLACFPDAQIRLWARRPDAAETLRDHLNDSRVCVEPDLAEAIRGADVIHTTTASVEAFLTGALLEPGQHVNLVGASLAAWREIDDEGVARVTMFTDSLESSSRESGEIIDAKAAGVIGADYPVTEIGTVLQKKTPGRVSAEQITAYKSHGLIVQDLMAAAVLCGLV
ncbi:ornithine cyclodeaminase family protein [Chachezhania antarctica]|uniref:ornithine cyclodeaminase family protein n=1 Tax=Chachezhania antarctica TaxID=2340860 RepID=UPI000EB2A5B4|nr:ornithine cyclodeaminase family protein [Chachezhania antarctica]|tara:strand:+ start:3377 stop:4309 length:933 start_codon:yes stop_codon:yes gene_type:complete